MAYLGKELLGILSYNKVMDSMTGDGSDTTLTLSRTPGSVNNVEVFMDGICQTPGTEYTLSGNTLTFTTAPETGVKVVAISGNDSTIQNPRTNSITGAKILDNSVTNAAIVALSSSKLTGALPALSGASLTNVPSGVTTSANDPAINTNPSGGVGTLWVNKTSGEMYVCTDATAGANVWTNVGPGTGDVEPWTFGGTIAGYTSGGSNMAAYLNTIDKHSFTADENATDVGDLTVTIQNGSGQSSSTHGYHSGGYNSTAGNTIIQKYSFATNENSSNVSVLSVGRFFAAGISSETHGFSSGGEGPEGTYHDTVDKFPFATDSNATDVGNLTQQRQGTSGTQSSDYGYTTAGKVAGSSYFNIIDRFAFASNNNATDVGDATVARAYVGNQSSTTHGYTSGGFSGSGSNVIDKVQFVASANSTDVGDLPTSGGYRSGQSSTTHGYVTGRYLHPSFAGVIEKFAFSTDQNASDIGDLSVNRYGACGTQV